MTYSTTYLKQYNTVRTFAYRAMYRATYPHAPSGVAADISAVVARRATSSAVQYRVDEGRAGFWKECGKYVAFIPYDSAHGKRLLAAFAMLGIVVRHKDGMQVSVSWARADIAARLGGPGG